MLLAFKASAADRFIPQDLLLRNARINTETRGAVETVVVVVASAKSENAVTCQ